MMMYKLLLENEVNGQKKHQYWVALFFPFARILHKPAYEGNRVVHSFSPSLLLHSSFPFSLPHLLIFFVIMFLSHPIVSKAVPTTSPHLRLPPFIIQNLKEKGIVDLFPSQAEIVPFLMKERFDFFFLTIHNLYCTIYSLPRKINSPIIN